MYVTLPTLSLLMRLSGLNILDIQYFFRDAPIQRTSIPNSETFITLIECFNNDYIDSVIIEKIFMLSLTTNNPEFIYNVINKYRIPIQELIYDPDVYYMSALMSLPVFEWFMDEYVEPNGDARDILIRSDALYNVAIRGSYSIFKFIHTRYRCPITYTCLCAVLRMCDLDMMDYVIENMEFMLSNDDMSYLVRHTARSDFEKEEALSLIKTFDNNPVTTNIYSIN